MYPFINEYKLSKEAKDTYDLTMRLLKTSAARVSVPRKFFDQFVEAMPVTLRKQYAQEIPVGDKVMVRK